MKNLNVGVIGTGHLGKIHSKLMKDVTRANFVGVYDLNYEIAQNVAKELSVKAFEDLNDFLNNIDAVSIVATTSAHYNLIKESLNQNVHVFVEKPITSTIPQAEEVVKLADEKKKKAASRAYRKI